MNIEIAHNPDRLPCRAKLYVRNPYRAEMLIREMMRVKQPLGMRVRHTHDVKEGFIELEARNTEPLRVTLRYLKDRGII